jgi:filamentous hemagglutinin family protein
LFLADVWQPFLFKGILIASCLIVQFSLYQNQKGGCFMTHYLLIIFLTIVFTYAPTFGDVISDNTLGTEVTSAYSTYQITGGKIKGNNIFHSFEKFSLESYESAEFNDMGFLNSISRVTGSEMSHIDGMITTGAENFYFLNPNGVVLGPNAILNTMGSFHISTADYLQFSDNETFYADKIQSSVLSSAPVSAFGFLDDDIGGITVDSTFSYFMEDKTLSLFGGDINMNDAMFMMMSGHLNIAGLASPGIIQPISNDLVVTAEKLGNITLLNSYFDFQGNTACSFVIHGNHISLINDLSPDEPWTWNDYGIWIQQFEHSTQQSVVRVMAQEDLIWENVSLYGSGEVFANAGSLVINAGNIQMSGLSTIDLSGNGTGAAGTVDIIADKDLSISGDAKLFIPSHQTSQPGHILLHAGETLMLDMTQHFDTNTFSTTPSIDFGGSGTGGAGEMTLKGQNIHILNDTLICGDTKEMRDMPKFTIIADETFKIESENEFSRENISFFSTSGGAGGALHIDSPDIRLNKAMILISNRNEGSGPMVSFTSDHFIMENASSINIVNYDNAKGCKISLLAKDTMVISGRSTSLEIGTYGTQKGGSLRLEANNISVLDGATLSTDTSHEGDGGELYIIAHEKLYMYSKEKGDMYHAESRISSRAMAPDDQVIHAGDGGIIHIQSPSIELGRTAKIIASTYSTGNAGKIIIETDHLSMAKDVTDGEYASIFTASIHRKKFDQHGLLHGNAGQIIIGQTIIEQENGWFISEPANQIALYNNATISSSSEGLYSGHAGNITLGVSHLTVDHSTIKSYAVFSQVDTDYISFSNAGKINIGGVLHVDSNGTLLRTDMDTPSQRIELIDAAISTLAYGSTHANDNSSAGDMIIQSEQLILNEQSTINSAIVNSLQSDILFAGNAGNIVIENTSFTHLDNQSFISTATDATQSFAKQEKKATISILTPQLRLDHQSFIQSSSINRQAGEISILSTQFGKLPKIFLDRDSYLSTISYGGGDAGSIQVNGDHIEILNGSFVSSANVGLDTDTLETFDFQAGEIHLSAKNDVLIQHGQVTTDSQSGGGGKIFLNAGLFYALDSGITSNVNDGSGKGGDISLKAHQIVMNNSRISANAVWGDGGAIFIESDVYIKSPESIVEATSERGNDGEVTIDAPDVDISSSLVALASNFLDASKWMKNSCSQRSSENISRLIVRGKDATPTKPDDLHSSPSRAFKDIQIQESFIQSLIAKAQTCSQKGEFESAAAIWYDVALQLNKNEKEYLRIVTYLIQALQDIGFHHKAKTLAKKVLPEAEKRQSSPEGILFYNTYGDLLLSLNEIPDAITYLNIALTHARTSKNPEIMASVMNHIANVVVVDDDVHTGVQIYDNALKLLSNTDNHALKAKILLNLAYVISMIGTYEETSAAFEDALHMIQTLPDNYDKAFNLIALSETGLMMDHYFPDKKSQSEISRDLLASAQAIGQKIGDHKIISMASGNAGKIFEKSGHLKKALNKTRYAIFTAQQQKDKEIAYKWHWQAARLFKKLGNERQAIQSYQKAISVLSDIREELFRGIRLKMDIFEIDVKPVYLGLAEIYLDQADRENNPTIIEKKLILARDVMEKLKNAELSDYFEDECVVKKQPTRSNAMNRTPEGIALLYPIALPERLTVLITLPDTIKHYNLDIRYADINKLVRTYRKCIQIRSNNHFLGISQRLYQLLIQPVERDLIVSNIHTLLVAPDGVLRLVPFSSLHDKEKFLIEKYAIVTIPAINLTDISTYKKKNTETLVVGLSEAVQDFSALPSVKDELKDIKTIMNGKKMYMNTDFTIPNVQEEFNNSDYDIVHFATHGVFGGTGKNSFLLTYEKELNMNALEDLMSLGKYRNHQVDLLTLSACQTALGNERAALGLAGVAVKAGVRSAVATLWYVDDEATSLAIRDFYRQLKKENMTKAKALQNAQKMLISKRRYWHPIYWAPFLLIGSWI